MTTTETVRLTDDDLENLARTHLATNPDDTAQDVFRAIRDGGYTGLLQSFQVHEACEKIRPTPTLTTVADARATMEDLAGRYDWVSVFWDRGWGDSGQVADISITVDGDGQMPIARITDDVYRDLLAQGIIAPNSLRTYKARKSHDFKG
jgi:hypothetical protein